MELSQRHKTILKALIDDFLSENRPVGSKTLHEKYNIGLSPATIRNVFRELEDYGFINSRHHSGGRIPTDMGYRFYLDSLITIYELTVREKQRIQEEYLKYQFELDQVLNATCNILSALSQNASVVLSPKRSEDMLKHLELIHVSGEEILVIMVTRSGSVFNKTIFAGENISQESLYKISKFFNENAKGFDVSYVFNELIAKMKVDPHGPKEFKLVADTIKSAFLPEFDERTGNNLYIDGLQNLYNNFKSDEIEQIENILSLLDNKKLLNQIFSQYIDSDEVSALIGDKNDKQLCGVSIVARNYKMGDKRIGSVGIIGPQRMNYNRAVALVEYTSNMVSEMLTRMSR
jgi:heat-inducible transcriptional repressor